MKGTLVNSLSIIVGSFIGFLFKGGIPDRINDTIMKGLSLCVLLIGLTGAIKVDGNRMLIIIFSIVLGGIIGEIIDIHGNIQKLGYNIEKRAKGLVPGGKISEGFTTASILYCVGAMAIVGSLESGLTGNHQTLYAKSVLDGVTSVVFASSLGIGVALSSISVLIYQGVITLCASLLKGVLVATVINDISVIGSLLIIGISFNMLEITEIKIANFLPAVFIPVIYQLISKIFVL